MKRKKRSRDVQGRAGEVGRQDDSAAGAAGERVPVAVPVRARPRWNFPFFSRKFSLSNIFHEKSENFNFTFEKSVFFNFFHCSKRETQKALPRRPGSCW